MQFYNQNLEEIYKELNSNTAGLSQSQVISVRQKYGENKLPEEKHITYLEIFFNQFKSPLIYILLISALIVLLLGDNESAIVIGIVLVLNSIIGTFQEGKARLP